MTGGFKDHFSERAAGYASYRPHYPPALAAWLASVAPARDAAWDVACGSGQLSTLLADHFTKVVATDASGPQVEKAVKRPNIDYRVEPAEQASLENASVDLVTVAQAAHWFDLNAFYKEAKRVSRPRGVIALVAYEKTQVNRTIDAVIERFYSGDLDRWWPPERKHVENGYRSLSFPFPRIDAPSMEMSAMWTADQLIGYVKTWSAVRAMEASGGAAATERFASELRDAWGAGERGVKWPLVIAAGRL